MSPTNHVLFVLCVFFSLHFHEQVFQCFCFGDVKGIGKHSLSSALNTFLGSLLCLIKSD